MIKGQDIRGKGHNYRFLPLNFSNLGQSERYTR